MKFEKTPNSSVLVLTAEQIAAANRYEERMAKAKAERNRPDNPYMRQRVAKLFRELLAELDANTAPRRRQDWRGTPAQPLSLDELVAKYTADPVKLSDEAIAEIKW